MEQSYQVPLQTEQRVFEEESLVEQELRVNEFEGLQDNPHFPSIIFNSHPQTREWFTWSHLI